jgi:hypothetical protein
MAMINMPFKLSIETETCQVSTLLAFGVAIRFAIQLMSILKIRLKDSMINQHGELG